MKKSPADSDRPARQRGTTAFGLFQREQRSLFGEILDWMLTPLLLLWPLSLALTWFVAQGIANKPFDRALEFNLQAPFSTILLPTLLQGAAALAKSGKRVIYVSGEEAVAQVRLRAQRLGLGDAPVLGALFRSSAYQRSQTELVVIVTPHLVTPVAGEALALPTDRVKIPTERVVEEDDGSVVLAGVADDLGDGRRAGAGPRRISGAAQRLPFAAARIYPAGQSGNYPSVALT